jgi:hypothetical protein
MRVNHRFGLNETSFGSCVLVAIICLASSVSIRAQVINSGVAGNNAVYSASKTISPSTAFVDASALSGTDFCGKITAALQVLNTTTGAAGGGVIDARGINPGSTNSCSVSPWASSTLTAFPAAVILLPAGTITLQPGANWILPNATRIIGEGPGSSGASMTSPSVTTITVATGFSGDMIEMGWESTTPPTGYPFSPCPIKNSNVTACFGVSVESLSLNGGGSTLTGVVGIENDISQERSYVDRVSMYSMAGTGLKIGAQPQPTSGCCQAQNSGPYSSIYFEASGTASTCANILGQGDLRGIHGITCIGNGSTNAAIYLDSSNVTIEDAHIDGFTTGILVGSNSTSTTNPVRGNVLLNIAGSVDSGSMSYLIEISSNNSSNTMDLSILGATSLHDSIGNPTNTIYDQLSNTTLPYTTDSHVSMYVLGESIPIVGTTAAYSRFTTSPTYPSWAVGSVALTSGAACTSVGSLDLPPAFVHVRIRQLSATPCPV